MDNLGKIVDVKLKSAVNGKKKFTGELRQYEDGMITVLVDGEPVSFEQNQAASVKLHIDIFSI